MEAGGNRIKAGRGVRRHAWLIGCVAALVLPATALAHVERPSYWPDPAADDGFGGAVPESRSLDSALTPGPGETVHVVCQDDSIKTLKKSTDKARKKGYKIRPTDAKQPLSKAEANELIDLNKDLFELCEYENIQAAVDEADNDDRVVVLPGDYIEKPSREAPTFDPTCDEWELPDGSVSYEYQVNCPNDQSLVFVQGRSLAGDPPNPPLDDRHGIPDAGECIRCNLQIEGSGLLPQDVLLDAAKKPDKTELKELGKPVKDVGIRVDRADGFVAKNMTFAHAAEHGIYAIETDGFLFEKTKFFYNGEYGALMFTSDHGMIDTCEGMGHGDSAVYPGAAPDTGEDAADDAPVFYPDAPRTSNTITNCDIHHNTLGYSGTMGNATRVTENNFYDNGTAITTDSLGASGHPGFPQDSARFDHNRIYSNNFNSFVKSSDVVPRVPTPVGVGFFLPGGNNNEFDHNEVYDNWRRGTMQLTLPEAFEFGDGSLPDETSHRNEYHDNLLGLAPNGKQKPNGVDFWWDEASWQSETTPGPGFGAEDNCWYSNDTYTSDPPPPDVPGTSPPGRLPEDCENESNGNTYGDKMLNELLGCLDASQSGNFDPKGDCIWFKTPPKPGSPKARTAKAMGEVGEAIAVFDFGCDLVGDTESCEAFSGRL